MTDLRTLHDAFAELERRADAAASAVAPASRPRRAVRLVPVAATVVAVAGLAAGAMLLAPGDDSGVQAGSPPTASPTASSTTAPPTTTAKSRIPTSPQDLIDRFKVVLGGTATFEVTDTAGGPLRVTVPPDTTGTDTPSTPVTTNQGTSDPGAFIVGTLTNAAGVKGGFDLQIYDGGGYDDVFCDDADPATCSTSTLADGSKLAVQSEQLQDPGGVTYMANLVYLDHTVILMHISNQQDPKGMGQIYSPAPPLTIDQLKAIVLSDKWW